MSRLERIVEACGGDLFDGGRRALISGPGHSARDRSVSLLETEDGRIIIHCFSPKDDWREVRRALNARGLLVDEPGAPTAPALRPRPAPPPSRIGERIARAKRFWEEAIPIAGTPAECYLLRRAIAPMQLRSPALRFHSRMTSLEDRISRPALLSAITGADAMLQGIEVTLVSAHGSTKAAVATPRRVIGTMMGGAVRLSAFSDTLIVAEGVETALSASAALCLPAWALLSAHNLSLFRPPSHLRRLVAALDHDTAGKTAFERLWRRLPTELCVECAPLPQGYNDWNDWARQTRIIS